MYVCAAFRNEALHIADYELQMFLRTLHNQLDTVALHPTPEHVVGDAPRVCSDLHGSHATVCVVQQQSSHQCRRFCLVIGHGWLCALLCTAVPELVMLPAVISLPAAPL